jgi:hypothetical protein
VILESTDENSITLSDDAQLLIGDVTWAPDRKTGTRKWMTMKDIMGYPQGRSKLTDLILEKLSKRLQNLALLLKF